MTSARRRARQRYHGSRDRGSIYTGLPGVPPYLTSGQAGPARPVRKQRIGPRRKRMLAPHLTRKGVWSLRWTLVDIPEGE